MTQPISNLKDTRQIEKIFGEDARRSKKYFEYFYKIFRCGMSFRKQNGFVIYFTVGQKY